MDVETNIHESHMADANSTLALDTDIDFDADADSDAAPIVDRWEDLLERHVNNKKNSSAGFTDLLGGSIAGDVQLVPEFATLARWGNNTVAPFVLLNQYCHVLIFPHSILFFYILFYTIEAPKIINYAFMGSICRQNLVHVMFILFHFMSLGSATRSKKNKPVEVEQQLTIGGDFDYSDEDDSDDNSTVGGTMNATGSDDDTVV